MHRHSFKLVKAAGPMRSDSQSSSAKHRLSRDGLWKNLLLGHRASCSIGRQGWEYCSCLHGPKAKSGASRSGVEKKKREKTRKAREKRCSPTRAYLIQRAGGNPLSSRRRCSTWVLNAAHMPRVHLLFLLTTSSTATALASTFQRLCFCCPFQGHGASP